METKEEELMEVQGIETKYKDRSIISIRTVATLKSSEYEDRELLFHQAICNEVTSLSLPAPHIVKECACRATGITIDEFDSGSRKRERVLARQIAMTYYLSNDLMFHYSLERIGDAFGKKDHATVVHAGRSITHLLETKDRQALQYVQNFVRVISEQKSSYPTNMTPIDRKNKVEKRDKIRRDINKKLLKK